MIIRTRNYKEAMRLADIINGDEIRSQNELLTKKQEENKVFVGRVFKEKSMYSKEPCYYKVISAKADDAHSVSCLVLDVSTRAVYRPQLHKMYMAGDDVLGMFSFCPIFVKSTRVDSLKRMQELEPSEFDERMAELSAKIREIDWDSVVI